MIAPKLLFISLLLSSTSAFVGQHKTKKAVLVKRHMSEKSSLPSFDVNDVMSRFDNINADKIRDNVFDGEFGSRGESYVLAQLVVGLCILAGNIPFVGDIVSAILGPGLILAGIAVAVLGVTDLGESLSPWPVPAKSSKEGLVTDGVYEKMRHPIYSGLLAASAGLSIVTGSATRLLLTAVLLYVLDVKTDFEEKEMAKKFPEYESYKTATPGKFFPQEFLDKLPWVSKD